MLLHRPSRKSFGFLVLQRSRNNATCIPSRIQFLRTRVSSSSTTMVDRKVGVSMNELCIGFQGRLLYQILENIRMCFIRTSQAVLDFTRTFFSQLIPMIRKRSVSNVDTRDYLGWSSNLLHWDHQKLMGKARLDFLNGYDPGLEDLSRVQCER